LSENIAEVFATTDVFAFPTAEGSYGSSDLALQEAMLAGLPAVIYADRGPSHFVENEKTGLVVSNAMEFTAAIERLYHDPAFDARSAPPPRDMPRQSSVHTNMRCAWLV
jgi:glycosyltransferase involved in cell wall biosynthesis